MRTGHPKRYGTAARVRFAFRSNPTLEKQVDALMRHYGYYNYSDLFRTLVREAWQRIPTTEGEA